MNSEHSILDIVGILAVPNHNRVMFSEVYEKKKNEHRPVTGGFLRLIDSEHCRANVLGFTSVVWLLNMLDDSIRFHVAPFPDGFLPCSSLAAIGAAPLHDFMLCAPRTAIEVTPLVYQFPPLATCVIEAAPVATRAIEAAPVAYEIEAAPFQHLISPPPAGGECGSVFFPPDLSSNGPSWSTDFDYDFPTVTGSEGYLDNSMFDDYQMVPDASVGYCRPAPPSRQQFVLHQRLIWKVTVVTDNMEPASIGWDTLRLTSSGDAVHTPTGFSGSQNQAKHARVDYFFALLDSDNQELVQQGITEVIQLHMFKELIWISLLRPIISLAQNRNENGRIADLFPEEVRDHNGLAKGVVGTLVTIIYHTFHIWRSPKTQGRRLDLMYDIFMASLTRMYANLDCFPEFKEAGLRNDMVIKDETLQRSVCSYKTTLGNLKDVSYGAHRMYGTVTLSKTEKF
ncbi:hypothetical protein F4604DRAFT_1672479 [Suillus subluteus]|nr:hypothetical protein F4604DRAFT_1672479 [Suillus subluteus]